MKDGYGPSGELFHTVSTLQIYIKLDDHQARYTCEAIHPGLRRNVAYKSNHHHSQNQHHSGESNSGSRDKRHTSDSDRHSNALPVQTKHFRVNERAMQSSEPKNHIVKKFKTKSQIMDLIGDKSLDGQSLSLNGFSHEKQSPDIANTNPFSSSFSSTEALKMEKIEKSDCNFTSNDALNLFTARSGKRRRRRRREVINDVPRRRSILLVHSEEKSANPLQTIKKNKVRQQRKDRKNDQHHGYLNPSISESTIISATYRQRNGLHTTSARAVQAVKHPSQLLVQHPVQESHYKKSNTRKGSNFSVSDKSENLMGWDAVGSRDGYEHVHRLRITSNDTDNRLLSEGEVRRRREGNAERMVADKVAHKKHLSPLHGASLTLHTNHSSALQSGSNNDAHHPSNGRNKSHKNNHNHNNVILNSALPDYNGSLSSSAALQSEHVGNVRHNSRSNSYSDGKTGNSLSLYDSQHNEHHLMPNPTSGKYSTSKIQVGGPSNGTSHHYYNRIRRDDSVHRKLTASKSKRRGERTARKRRQFFSQSNTKPSQLWTNNNHRSFITLEKNKKYHGGDDDVDVSMLEEVEKSTSNVQQWKQSEAGFHADDPIVERDNGLVLRLSIFISVLCKSAHIFSCNIFHLSSL